MKQAKYQYIVDDILTQMTDNSLRPGLTIVCVPEISYRANAYLHNSIKLIALQ